jgi:septal ring factor EnvC (AmiA/AmiB activator)
MLDKIKEYLYENKKYIVIAIVLLVAILVYNNVRSVSDNEQRIDRIKSELEQSREYNNNAKKRLDTIENRLSDSTNRVNISTERIITVEKRIEASQTRLDEGERNIFRIREILKQAEERGE